MERKYPAALSVFATKTSVKKAYLPGVNFWVL
jgi:hypothetical protein